MAYLSRMELKGDWQLKVVPNEVATGCACRADWENLSAEAVSAAVPGDWVLDWVRAGRLPDPFFGDNFTKLYAYERHHLYYVLSFNSDIEGDDLTYLRFDGIDTVADVFLNGQKIGHAENMFVEHEFAAKNVVKGTNELLVHIYPVGPEAEKYPIGADAVAFKYNKEALVIRKATHMFGWDICPRILGGGLWKRVYLLQKKTNRIQWTHLITSGFDDDAGAKMSADYFLELTGEINDYEIGLEGVCGSSRFSVKEKPLHSTGKAEFIIDKPKLWWVRGYGEPNLYDVTVTLYRKGEAVDSLSFRYGIRTVELIRDDVTSRGKRGEFIFKINGKRVFIKGTNWVPCDAFHARDEERMPAIFDLVWDCGCNAIRVWGGGVYESDAFYDKCDEKGIFVWQDFMMACALYPQTERMKEQLTEEATKVVRRLRNHPSLCLWAGDNECDVAYKEWFGGGKDPEKNCLTRVVLPSVLKKEDPSVPYLPSSPYLSPEAVKSNLHSPEQHLWGPRKYFKGSFYRDNDATFASEMGYHGCCSVESIKKFIPKEYLWGYKNNKMWLYHAASPELKNSPYTYRIRLMARQIRYFFGDIPRSLEKFARMSQIVQAEAKKYFVESFRSRMWSKTGLIWWNIMDCWPQFSDAVADYYFDKKLAYYYIKNSQKPLLVTMDGKRELTLSQSPICLAIKKSFTK